MTITLKHYRDYRLNGRIYAFCEGDIADKEIIYSLHQGGQLIKKEKGIGDEMVSFSIPHSGICNIKADITDKDLHNKTLHSDDIRIPQITRLPPRPAPYIKNLKGRLALIPGVDNYLQIKFTENGLEKLKNERKCYTPQYYTLRNTISFVPLFTHDAIKKWVKSMPVLGSLVDVYKVEGDIPECQLLALAHELERLDYVEYCCFLSKLVGARRPEGEGDYDEDDDDVVAEDVFTPDDDNEASHLEDHNTQRVTEENNDSQIAPLIATPDFTSLQTYLDNGLGLNVRPAWARNASGQNTRIHLADERIDAEHEDLINSVTVVESGSTGTEGTANTGVIRANNNGFGVTGIAFNSNVFIYSNNNINAIFNNMHPGDIVVINSYIFNSVNEFVFFPIVHSRAGWDAVSNMVKAGAVVIFSSGEVFDFSSVRGINLLQSEVFNNWGDSGAIMVCGCTSNNGLRSHETNFNLYGMLNAWDEGITSTGGWSRFFIFNEPPRPHRAYTNNADFTSVSAAQVAGAIALVQSYARTRYGVVFNTADMLSVIETTGSREAQGQMIGVRPNVELALLEVDFLLGDGPLPPPPPPHYPAWRENVQYEVGDRVFFSGANFLCQQRHVSSRYLLPSRSPTLWLRLTSPQIYSPWGIGFQYTAGFRVTYEGVNYQCLQRHVPAFKSWAPPQNPLLWVKI